MKKLLNDMNKEKVCSVIDESLSSYCRKIAQSGNKPFGFEKNISWVKTYPTCWSNFIFRADFDLNRLEEQVKEVSERMKAGELPAEWVIGPETKPADLYGYLTAHGFAKQYNMAGMAVDLTKLDGKIKVPGNVEIRIADNADLLYLWTEVLSQGLFEGSTVEYSLFEKLLTDTGFRFYVAFFNGRVVATSMLQISEGAAAIDMVSTLPEYRGLGIGTAITMAPLLDAREMGCTIGVLQASAAGEPVYRKIGFEEYCRFHVCKLI